MLASSSLHPQHVARLLTNQLLARARQVAHLLGLRIRHKARPDQTVRQQFGQPHGIIDVGLTARHILHVRGVCQHQLKFAIVQDVSYRFPVDAGRLHSYVRATVDRQPLRYAQKLRRGRLECTNFRRHLAIAATPSSAASGASSRPEWLSSGC
jgi:hypothetical protein